MSSKKSKQAKPKTGLARCMELASGRKGLVFLSAVLSADAAAVRQSLGLDQIDICSADCTFISHNSPPFCFNKVIESIIQFVGVSVGVSSELSASS